MGSAWLGSARLSCSRWSLQPGGHPLCEAKRHGRLCGTAQSAADCSPQAATQRNALYTRGASYYSQRSIRTAQGVTDSTVSQDAPEPVAYTLLPLWTLLPEPKGSNFLKAVLAYMQALLPMGRQALLSAAAALILRVNSVESVGTAAVTHG